MNPDPHPEMTRAGQELGERAPLDEVGAHRDIATAARTWLLYCCHLIAGVLAGLAMSVLCVLALVEVLYFGIIPCCTGTAAIISAFLDGGWGHPIIG